MTSFTGIIEENWEKPSSLPFTALLVVFAVVAVIHDQHLFKPVIDYVFLQAVKPSSIIFIANGILSMISDNVFVATIYINEIKAALDSGEISRDQFDALAVAINTGINLPSVATPNGQAAFSLLANIISGSSYWSVLFKNGQAGSSLYNRIELCWINSFFITLMNRTFCIAPMMGRTDTHFRNLCSLLQNMQFYSQKWCIQMHF